ncbi:MAG: DNA repair protein RadA [Nitriliruptorales bacterium]|nr:DNA repair protein RadA [Nitriliruptorales bacterium]
MARTKTQSRCSACGHSEPRWVGRCPGCAAWGTMGEETLVAAAGPSARAPVGQPRRAAQPIRQVSTDQHDRAATDIGELDRVLGGGLVPGSVVLLGGEPGAGKSTLLLQAADAFAAGGRTVLYMSAEESPGQVRLRAQRLGALSDRVLLAGDAEVPAILALVQSHAPDVLIVDSIQTVRIPEVSGSAGSVTQVRESAAAIVAAAKEHGIATVLVGHVTKDGQLAGPRVLEHLVDAVCDIEGDRHHALRLLRATKNRFGPVGEVGCFEMTGKGLVGVEDAGRLFMGDTPPGTTGVAVTITLEGRRPLACEVQALVAKSVLTNPRRVASGLDAQRLNLLVAVLESRSDVTVANCDVYASSVGGVRLTEPAVDLALCTAIASARRDVPVLPGRIVLGEVGLAGELRLVAQTQRRLAEAARLGFTSAVVPAAYDGPAHGLQLHRARVLSGALDLALSMVSLVGV